MVIQGRYGLDQYGNSDLFGEKCPEKKKNFSVSEFLNLAILTFGIK